ncbi:MAG: hypothetical protein AAGD00_07420 [Planctomycetota bacterium]
MGVNNNRLRRVRYGVLTTVLLTAITAASVVIIALGTRFKERVDVTATRQHELSDRTQRAIDRLDEDLTILVSANTSSLDLRVRQRIGDVLAEFDAASPRVSVEEIDSGSGNAGARLGEFLGSLTSAQEDEVARHREAIESVRQAATAIAARTDEVVAQLESMRDAIDAADPRREQLTRAVGLVRSLGVRAAALDEPLELAGTSSSFGVQLPESDTASTAASPLLLESANTFNVLATFADAVLQEETGDDAIEPLGAAAARLSSSASSLRDIAARANDRLAVLTPLEPLLVARVLRDRNAVFVTIGGRVSAIDFAQLFPPALESDPDGGSIARLRFVGEELIGGAIASMQVENPPILVLVHAEAFRVFDPPAPDAPNARRLSPTGQRLFARTLGRLALRQIDTLEWATGLGDPAPSLGDLDPDQTRPLVYLLMGPPLANARDPNLSDEDVPARGVRLGRLVETASQIVESRGNVLLCIGPSDLVATGTQDPFADIARALGVNADTGRLLVTPVERAVGSPLILTEQRVRDAASDHPIARAIDSLRVALPGSVALRAIEDADSAWLATPILAFDEPEGWAENEWYAIPYLRQEQPIEFIEPPTADGEQDRNARDALLTIATQRLGDRGDAQRAVVVGSQLFMSDLYAWRGENIEGRPVASNPGNMELLEASVLWLANMDEMIAPAPSPRDVPRIAAISEGQLLALRWLLIAGVPVGVLALGIGKRLILG